jgi:hypothetical protein
MKKLMFVGVAALCAAVGFSDGIESANVVGYVGTPVAANTWQINGCQFQNTGDTEMDLQDLVVGFASKSVPYDEQDAFKATAPCIQIQDRDANGNLTAGTTFYYYLSDAAVDANATQTRAGWADGGGYYVGEGAYSPAATVGPGLGFWFKDYKSDVTITFQK